MVLVVVTGCAFAARDHACYPYLEHRIGGPPPPVMMRTLASERGTRKEVAHHRAPPGYYWRRRHGGTLDVTDVHSVTGGYELAQCPAVGSGGAALPQAR